MSILTNQKSTMYHNLYENTGVLDYFSVTEQKDLNS